MGEVHANCIIMSMARITKVVRLTNIDTGLSQFLEHLRSIRLGACALDESVSRFGGERVSHRL